MDSLEEFGNVLKNVTYNSADPRIRDRFLMGSPGPVITVILCQFSMLKGLQWFMSKRKEGFKLGNLSLTITIYLFFGSLFFAIESSRLGWLSGYNWFCEPIDRSTSQRAIYIVELCHKFVMFKLTYAIELVGFILRKKEQLVTFYIFFHHMTFPLVLWIATNHQPGGHITFTGFVNSLFHVILLAAIITCTLRPGLKGPWFNKVIIYGHGIQFVVIFLHEAQLLFYKDCKVAEEALPAYIAASIFYVGLLAIMYFMLRKRKTKKC